jgi:uncharacterized protein YbgA (DUF1722 family)
MNEIQHRSMFIMKAFRDSKPSTLQNAQLLDYHRKTHMLYAANIKREPVNKKFVNYIVSLHNKFVKEMLKRGMNHNTPLEKI